MIRVLHYGMSPNLGGIETYLGHLSDTVDRDRFHFDFLYSDNGSPPVFAARLGATGSAFLGVTPRRESIAGNRRDLEALFARKRFDILHFHANTASYVEPVEAALRHGVRVIVHSHNAGTSRSPVTQLLHRWNRRTLGVRAVTRVAVSTAAGAWMFGRSPFEVVPNGIDIDDFAFRPESREGTRKALGLHANDFVVGTVGAFLPAKNHPFALAVFGEVLQRRPEAVLLLVGDGPLEADVRDLVSASDLRHKVRFLGRRTDVPRLLSAMDCLLFPSRYEGFGLAVLEAEAAGLPGCVSEAVPQEVVLVPTIERLPLTAAPSVWAEAVVRLGSAPDRLRGCEAVRRAGYSVTANTGTVQSLYERLLS